MTGYQSAIPPPVTLKDIAFAMLVRTPRDRKKRASVPTLEFESALTDLPVPIKMSQ
jgi:hypothetical protein